MESVKEAGGLGAIVLALMTFVKDMLPESWNRALPLFAIMVAIGLCFLLTPSATWQATALQGLATGLATAGVYRGYKVTVKGE